MYELKSYHWRTLDYAAQCSITDLNYHEFDDDIDFLEDMGYLIGSWYGSLDYSPGKRWEITSEGRQALKAYKLEQLINSTAQCPEGTCKGDYGTEIYIRTDCIKCGRQIIREKKLG